jgi:hypothetical protein
MKQTGSHFARTHIHILYTLYCVHSAVSARKNRV